MWLPDALSAVFVLAAVLMLPNLGADGTSADPLPKVLRNT